MTAIFNPFSEVDGFPLRVSVVYRLGVPEAPAVLVGGFWVPGRVARKVGGIILLVQRRLEVRSEPAYSHVLHSFAYLLLGDSLMTLLGLHVRALTVFEHWPG